MGLLMDEEKPPEHEPWEVPQFTEGFDVYDYDARRAKRGQRVVLAVFLITLVLLALMIWLNSQSTEPSKTRPRSVPSRYHWG